MISLLLQGYRSDTFELFVRRFVYTLIGLSHRLCSPRALALMAVWPPVASNYCRADARKSGEKPFTLDLLCLLMSERTDSAAAQPVKKRAHKHCSSHTHCCIYTYLTRFYV